MKRAGYLLVALVFMMNIGLMLAGSLGFDFGTTSAVFTNTYKGLPAGLQDLNAQKDFQDNLILNNDQNSPINDVNSQTGSSVLTDLSFIAPFSILSGFFTLFLFSLDMFLNSTFGLTLIAIQLDFPIEYIIFIGLFNFLVITFAGLEIFKEFVGARGGVR